MAIIRNEQGVMIARVSEEVAAQMTYKLKGLWRDYRTEGKPVQRVFEIREAQSMSIPHGSLYL